MIETLLDFGSAEGERMRQEANADLRRLNGTDREDERKGTDLARYWI